MKDTRKREIILTINGQIASWAGSGMMSICMSESSGGQEIRPGLTLAFAQFVLCSFSPLHFITKLLASRVRRHSKRKQWLSRRQQGSSKNSLCFPGVSRC